MGANVAWSCVRLSYLDAPLLSVLPSALLDAFESATESSKSRPVCPIDDGVAGMALWAFTQLDDLVAAERLAGAVAASCLSLGPLLSRFEWSAHEQHSSQSLERELGLLRSLAASSSVGYDYPHEVTFGLNDAAFGAFALRLVEAGRSQAAAYEICIGL